MPRLKPRPTVKHKHFVTASVPENRMVGKPCGKGCPVTFTRQGWKANAPA